MLELSATPRDRQGIYSNWLVDVRGMDLDREEMIKLPINVKVRAGDDWRGCLKDSVDCLKGLHPAAEALQSDTNRYIRPVLLVQVERTGKEQRETGFIHAEDAKEHLLRLGFHEREIAIKTAEVNDLKVPENLDLLSPTCPVRVIITKQALQEGWDCPFAYVLCALSASHTLNAMTQLIERRTPIIGISFGNPYLLSSFPKLQTYLVAYGDMPSLQQAAAGALLGQIDITGRLPISLPGLYPRGTGIQLKAQP